MPANALQALADELADDRRVSADEALRLRQQVFPDGVVSREEAEALIDLDSRVANNDDAWASAFVEAIADHVLNRGQYPGFVDDGAVAWLMQVFGREGARDTEVETLLKIIERAEIVPAGLVAFTRERCATYLQGRTFTAADVEMMRRCLYAADAFVTEDEAAWLFAIDAESDGRAHDPSWRDLFVKAMLNHLMGRHAPPMLEDAEGMVHRQAWLRDTSTHPMRNVLGMFKDGWGKWMERARSLEIRDQYDAYYQAVNENAEEDDALTPMERAWATGMIKKDGKLTGNEQALAGELEKISV